MFTVAKEYKLYAMVYVYKDGQVISVNSSYHTDNMARAQAFFEEDLKSRGLAPIVVMSEAQVKNKLLSTI